MEIFIILFLLLLIVIAAFVIRAKITRADFMRGGSDEYSLYVKDPWLFNIQVGRKKVEGRRGNQKKYAHWIGKMVTFYNENRRIPVKVNAIRHYPSLLTYLQREGYQNVDIGSPSLQHTIDAYHRFYSDKKIKESGGMLAIEIELV